MVIQNEEIEFIEKNKIVLMDTYMVQKMNYSYRNENYRTKLDHLIVYKQRVKIIEKNKY